MPARARRKHEDTKTQRPFNRPRERRDAESRSGEACALRERRPLGRDTATIACDRSGCPAQRFPAVVRRRLEPRHAVDPPGLSASLRLRVDRVGDGLCAFATSRLCVKTRVDGFVMTSCLCVFVFAMWVGEWKIRNSKFEIRNLTVGGASNPPPSCPYFPGRKGNRELECCIFGSDSGPLRTAMTNTSGVADLCSRPLDCGVFHATLLR